MEQGRSAAGVVEPKLGKAWVPSGTRPRGWRLILSTAETSCYTALQPLELAGMPITP